MQAAGDFDFTFLDDAWVNGWGDWVSFSFARAATYEIMNLYAVKMAAVFMISLSTLAIRTGVIARWIALLGYTFALILLLSGRYIEWILFLFPLWVVLISVDILVDNLRPPSQPSATSPRFNSRR